MFSSPKRILLLFKDIHMDFISVKEASKKLNISERRIQKLCESKRISGCIMMSGVWLIPENVQKPIDERISILPSNEDVINLNEFCKILSISIATGRNWIKLGKIKPKYTNSKTPYFDRSYVNSISNDLKSGINESLKSRRNKKFVSGNSFYNSYVSGKCLNLPLVQKLLEEIESQEIDITEKIIGYFLSDCALHFILSRDTNQISNNDSLFIDYLYGNINLKEKELIDALIGDKEEALTFANNHASLFKLQYLYENKEDVLGLIYISCKNIGNRKATGSYYTPTKIVNRLISTLSFNDKSMILDPCCGTGNFLLQLPDELPFDRIYGIDIDSISVKVTRINMALRYPNIPIKTIISHITESDYLMTFVKSNFTTIIGNPPWGYIYSDEQKKILRENYTATTNSNIESYDIFIEQSLRLLQEKGQLAFVLPEAMLNVKAHSDIRKTIINEANIKEIKYLGNAFDGVQCPCIILRLEKTNNLNSTIGMIVDDGTKEFKIKTERFLNYENFSFLTTDEEYKILEKIKKTNNCSYLLENADFALGIVTGNNKAYISSKKSETNELVLKGSDIYKFRIKPSNNFIDFKPKKFQQVAPTELYRAKEKLLYKFISNQLVFAYDNKQTLSLNSCNILIPKIQNLNIKYIMSILNSRVAQFIFKKEFNSIKVLRSHIESIPIPFVNTTIQEKIIKLADKLIINVELKELEKIYEELDNVICKLFNLNCTEIEIIKQAVDGENKFLN